MSNSLIAVKSKLVQAQTIPVTASWRQASFPLENFQAYTSGYGYRVHPISGYTKFHQGLDLAAPLGSYVRSWWSGQVVALSDHTGCGTMITIQSGKWTHIYCHLMGSVENTPKGTVLVDRSGGIVLWLGQNVPAGARIARVGMTGRTTGPHLHWELKYNGNHLDPADVLRQMFAERT
ncbi:M23 family metallopeptidase [Geminocystis sp. GBBB08]|uniref:M23 family metallopeptidase n=1 Tax=Geminocystis sp. GBBB08 TaxID=2604140 RepID=UPI0027E2A833|nr:M23 family metallopeptidase [Geminocystis sp. GBBB08]